MDHRTQLVLWQQQWNPDKPPDAAEENVQNCRRGVNSNQVGAVKTADEVVNNLFGWI